MIPVIPTVLSDWQSCYPGVTLDLQRANPSRDGAGVTEALPISAFLEMSDGNILDKQGIPTDKNAYVYRRSDKGGRWYLYFYDKESGKRHRFALKSQDGDIPEPTSAGAEKAWMLGVERFIELKGKSERGESVRGLRFEDMVEKFLAKERKKISTTPHTGISEARFRLLNTQLRWVSEFVGDTRKEVHKIRRNTFLNYEVWRKERAIQYGKDTPQNTTINQEISTLRRAFNEVAVAEGFIKRDSIPELPSIKLPKDKKHRRDDLTENEWLELEKCCRLYWIKGKTRILNDEYEMKQNSQGKWETKTNIQIKSERGRIQLIHREMLYLAMRISMDSGIRPGSLRKMKWRHITENTSIPVAERKTWVLIDVPAENTKTGRSYRCSAPIAKHLERLRKISTYTKPNDFIFLNQSRGTQMSERLWKDSISEALVEARLADWSEDDSNNCRKIDVHSGKNITWYSFRHTHITLRLNAGTPVPVIAANCDTSMKYIEEHYFHYRAAEQTEILGKGRKTLGKAEEHLDWIEELPNANKAIVTTVATNRRRFTAKQVKK